MENKAVPKRVVCFDALNVLACLSVIAMHCNGAVHVFAGYICVAGESACDVLAYWPPVFIAFRRHADALPGALYDKRVSEASFSENGHTACCLDCGVLRLLPRRGNHHMDRLARVAQQPDKLYDCAGVLVFFAVVSGLSFAAGAVAAFG